MTNARRDRTFWGLLLIGSGLLLAAGIFYRMDAAFLDRALFAEATVIDKSVRSRGGNSTPDRSIRYEWTNPERPDWKHRGTGSYSGGQAAFEALVIGESTVRIAWAHGDDGRSIESRLVEDGFIGVPWPMLIVGAVLLLATPIRFHYLRRRAEGNLS